MIDLIELQHEMRKSLQQYAQDQLLYDWQEMINEARFTGILNAIHDISPHCVTTIEESFFWYGEGILCVNEFKRRKASSPVGVLLFCPDCKEQHIDAPEPENDWDNPPHKSHKCHNCGIVWRPADMQTYGVEKIETRGADDTWPFLRFVPLLVEEESTFEHPRLTKIFHKKGNLICQYCDNYSSGVKFPSKHRIKFSKEGVGASASECKGLLHAEAQPMGRDVDYDFLIVIACDSCDFVEVYKGFEHFESDSGYITIK
jgi:hypothetical protein